MKVGHTVTQSYYKLSDAPQFINPWAEHNRRPQPLCCSAYEAATIITISLCEIKRMFKGTVFPFLSLPLLSGLIHFFPFCNVEVLQKCSARIPSEDPLRNL